VFKIPGKTFLVGEYGVLVGGKALGLATEPMFTLSDEPTEYHPKSAVGLFCNHQGFKFNSKVRNPYEVGGFGQSTAEFIFAWLGKNKKINSLVEIFNDYLNLFTDQKLENSKPSGADLVIQVLGNVVFFANPVEESKSMSWPFRNLSFFIISTGFKIKTHEHLETLDRKKLFELPSLSQNVLESFLARDESLFLEHLKNWSKKLNELSLQHTDVSKIKTELELFSKIKFVKPCGALGADVCLIFCDKNDKNEVKKHLISKNIQIQSDETQLAKGLL